MKFHWFAEATYPHLPNDFPDRGASSWVTPPAQLRRPAQGRRDVPHVHPPDAAGRPRRLRRPGGQRAPPDAVRHDAVAEPAGGEPGRHHRERGHPDHRRLAGALQSADPRRRGDGLSGLPLGRAADRRLRVRHADGFGVRLRQPAGRAARALPRGARADPARLEEPEPFAFNGKYNQLRYVNVWPRPVQKPPPIWVPGSGSVETWDLVIDQNYCYGHLSFSGLHSAKPTVDAYWEYVAERGGDDESAPDGLHPDRLLRADRRRGRGEVLRGGPLLLSR